jgi:hypothetical protein
MPSNAEQRRKYAASHKGRATKMWHNAKRRATATGSEVIIDVNWIETRLVSGHCQLTGLPFDLSPISDFSSNPYSPSLDKIDPKIKNYTPENTRVVLTAVNKTLNEYGEQTMLPILKVMVSVIENKQCL